MGDAGRAVAETALRLESWQRWPWSLVWVVGLSEAGPNADSRREIDAEQRPVAPHGPRPAFELTGHRSQSAGLRAYSLAVPRNVLAMTILVTANSLAQYPLIFGSESCASAMRR